MYPARRMLDYGNPWLGGSRSTWENRSLDRQIWECVDLEISDWYSSYLTESYGQKLFYDPQTT